jgi:hypothetical protein
MHNIDYNIGFQEKRQFVAENWPKPPKTVIITLALGGFDLK